MTDFIDLDDIDLGEPDIRAIRYGHLMDMQMFTDEGNVHLFNATMDLCQRLMVMPYIDRDFVLACIKSMQAKVATVHGETYDTEPEGRIQDWVNRLVCEPRGIRPVSRFEW